MCAQLSRMHAVHVQLDVRSRIPGVVAGVVAGAIAGVAGIIAGVIGTVGLWSPWSAAAWTSWPS